ncbi:putative porin [Salinimicrobium soli]|uniref:putative porin n=1 Tax=Salinimicrobium soli TaxID=1254399 RepID=UPI003AB01F0B
MKHYFILAGLLLMPFVVLSQIERPKKPVRQKNERLTERNQNTGFQDQDPQQDRKESSVEKAPINLYKIISFDHDTTFVDTSLHIYKDYRFNYLRKDNFGLLPFSNVGRPYTRLTYDFAKDDGLLPEMGASARHDAFMEVEDIYYYHVPTPFTELYFKTVFEQGQTLDSFFTINPSEDLNISLAYKGLRSLGIYQHTLVSSGNFRATVSYDGFKDRYHLRTHYVAQDLLNQENGGLTDRSLQQYILKDSEFQDRARLDVNYEDAENTLFGKRFYLDHSFDLINTGDSISRKTVKVGHRLNLSDKKYVFKQAAAKEIFGPSFEEVEISDKTELETFDNEVFVSFQNPLLGKLEAKAGYEHYNYGYNAVLDLESGFIPNRLTGNILSLGGEYENQLGAFLVAARGEMNLSGDFDGYDLEASAGYLLSKDIMAVVGAEVQDRAPDFNYVLYQSDYINYNWRNDFSNQNLQQLSLSLVAPSLVNVKADYSRIGNYTYFGTNEEGFVKPFQYDGDVNYLRVKAQREFTFGKFAFDNTILYQTVLNGGEVLNISNFVTRNSFYFSDHWFRKALFLQTGFTVNYFLDYYMDAYDPVLAEFYVQKDQELEGLKGLDFFFNGKIRQARIFFKLQRLDALLLGNNNFAAPGYPYRDFAIRFGLVWNFFM